MRTELYINNTLVDLKEDVQVSLNYAIADIRQPDKRNGSYSKTVTLPSTSKVDKLFTSIFQVDLYIQTSGTINFTPDFNPNLKATAVLYVDGLEQFRGFVKLDKVRRVQERWHKIEYDIIFFGDVSTIFGNLKDAKLTDLSFSEWNHTYSKAVQKATWGQTVGDGYLYRMIDYGANSPTSWDTANFFPGLYLKTYIDKIFNYAGFTYSSAFLTSSFFKHLFIPYNGDKLTLTATQVNAMLFSATKTTSLTSSSTTSSAQTVSNPVVFDAESSDPSNQYNTGTGYFTAATAGYYDFYCSGTISAVANGSTTVTTSVNSFGVRINFYKGTGITAQYYPCTGYFTPYSGTYATGYNFINGVSIQSVSPTIYLNAGETVNVEIDTNALISAGQVDWTITGLAFKNRVTNTSIVEGNTVNMNAAIPVDIKQSDLLMSVIRAFNLFVEPDRTQPNKLYIDTYSAFYGSGTTRDWSKKIDASQDMEIIPMGALDARRYRISYKDDGDYWNKLYRDKWNETYGEFHKDISNDFLQNQNDNVVLFSNTVMRGDNSHDRIVPTIYGMTSSGVPTPTKSNIRLLYDGGTYNTLYPWSYTSISGTSTETTYPYCGHLDNPYNPTVDLCFDVPREVFWTNPYGQFNYTNVNLYNNYHRAFIEEITDRNSKIIIAWFYLKPIDILQLSFRDKIFIEGNYYRLNKIIDYSPVSTKTTKVELLKISAAVPFTPLTNSPITLTYGEMLGDTRAPRSGNSAGNSSNAGDTGLSAQNSVIGSNNYVAGTARSVSISGSYLRVGENTQNITISASSGVTVASGLRNVTVVGTNDIAVTESDVIYLNGNKVSGQTNIYTVTTSQTIKGSGVYYCSGATTLTLSTSVLRTNDVIQIFNMGGSTITVAGGGINIIYTANNSVASYSLTNKYDSLTLRYTGTYYIIQ